jgi:GT2 family glycosyltransferase
VSLDRDRMLVLAVNYESSDVVDQFLASLADAVTPDVSVRVLDNSERDIVDPARAARAFGDKHALEVHRMPKNLGYFGAAAYGHEEFVRQHGEPAWTIVCNVDLVIDQAFFRKLHTQAPDVIAPAILADRTGADQNPHLARRISKTRLRIYEALFSHPRIYAWYEYAAAWKASRQTGAKRLQSPVRIYAPHGACIIFPRSYFEAGGTLKHPAFLYGEELFVGEMARSLGIAVRHEPSLIVRHKHQVSTSSIGAARRSEFSRQAVRAILDRFY